MDRGPCRAIIPRYHYDASMQRCFPFIYGGCGGNRNNFPSKTDCQHNCHDVGGNVGKVGGHEGKVGDNGGKPKNPERKLQWQSYNFT